MSSVAPDFIGVGPNDILTNFILDYEARANKTLQPAQPEQFLINSFSYELYLNALRIQGAALSNLPQFATAPALDLLTQGSGVTRLPAAFASCTMVLTLVPGHGNLIIPAGLRIQSTDGLATFVNPADVNVASTDVSATINAVCDTAGVAGNGYVANKISVILDPKPYLATAVNTNTTAGGSDIESDESLRERFYLAPNAYSTAGSRGAYIFHAKSANSAILDVSVNNATGGVVNIYPLVAGGTTPTQILNEVAQACNGDKVRPLTDTVNVISPTAVNYAVDLSIIAYASADPTTLVNAISAALAIFTQSQAKVLGLDVVMTQLIGIAASVPGVYKVIVNTPSADIALVNTQVSICTSIAVAITGTNNEK